MCCLRNDFVFFLIVLKYCAQSNSQDSNVVPYKSVENCRKSEYYDLDLFKCVECDAKKNLTSSEDHLNCICQSDAYPEVIYDSTTHQPICKTLKCKTCSKPEQPKCKLKYISSVRNGTNQKGVQIFEDDSKNCSCDSKLNTHYHDFCISSTLLKNFQHFSVFHTERSIYTDLKFLAFFCKVLRNSTACNHLANLCVRSFYSLEKNSPCSLFYVSQAADAAVYGDDEMDNVRPFLFYKKGKATRKDIEKTIDFSYSLNDGENAVNSLQFISVVYSLGGELLKIGELSTHTINLCHRNILSDYNLFKFAQNYEVKCKFTLDNLIEMSKTQIGNYFYSIFLNYTIDNVQYLQQVPILVRNAFPINEGENPSDWQLLKRFQLYDSHEILPTIAPLPLKYGDSSSILSQFKMIRYIDSFQIDCTIKDGNRISAPIIILHYTTIAVQRNSSLNVQYNYKFRINFTKTQNLNFYFELLLPLTSAIGFTFAVLRTFNYKTRQNKEYYDFSALYQFVLYLFSNCANAFFSVAMFVCLYAFFVHTRQNTIKLLMPLQQQKVIDVLIVVAFVLKSIYLAVYFWKIGHADIFFIDWERPKGYDTPSTIRSNLDTPSLCSSVSKMTRNSICDAVSAWRNFFIANEWLKISTKRKTSVLIQNITLLICLEISNFNLEKKDKTLTLAVIVLLQFVLYTGQMCINFLVIERLYGNPLQQFIDVCSTANISVFLLLHDSYGFYIHGRSPHGFSDTDMSSMIIQLQREAQSMCGKRGLLTGSDNQTYIILVPTDLRTYYAKLLTPFQKAVSISQTHFEKEFSQNKSLDCSLEKTSAAYSSVNRFFCAFIDHSIKDLDYIIKERTFIETLLNCEFESYLSETKGTFYIDNWNSFGKALLYGNDLQLFLFDLILFCCIFVLSNSPVLSAFVTSIFYKLFQIVLRSSIKTNVANKTLIDKRFLM